MQTAFKVTVAFNCAAICILLYAFSKDSARVPPQAPSQAAGTSMALPAVAAMRPQLAISPVPDSQLTPRDLPGSIPADSQPMLQELHIGAMPLEPVQSIQTINQASFMEE